MSNGKLVSWFLFPSRAHGVSPSYPVMLDGQGSYSEGMLRGLDYLLAEAGTRGRKVRQCWCCAVFIKRPALRLAAASACPR